MLFQRRTQPAATPADPRVSRTRRLLQQALWELLREEDFNSITVQDITRRAQVNRATFYDHFEDKYALIHDALRTRFQQRLEERLPPDPELSASNLRALALVVFEFIAEIPRPGRAPQCASHQPPIEILIQGLLEETLGHWFVRDQAMPASTARIRAAVLSWSIFGAAFQWVQSERRLPASALVDELTEILAHGGLRRPA